MDKQATSASKLAAVLRETKTTLFEYSVRENKFVELDKDMRPHNTISEFLSHLSTDSRIAEEDRWKAVRFFSGTLQGPVDIKIVDAASGTTPSSTYRRMRFGTLARPSEDNECVLEGYIRDVTEEKLREEELAQQAERDPLTKLYNQPAGKSIVDDYLGSKTPYSSCGIVVSDIDFFKNANDSYGHQFGNQVLVEFAHLLTMMFRPDDVIMRLGGDEFAIFLKDIDHASLMKKARQLVETVRELAFPEYGYSITCSVGVCFLPENVSGYTFDHLFRNADWALYRAKENGRNRYEFCDYLRRFELADDGSAHQDIDTRYLHGDIVSTAFEVFEKTGSFNEAINLLMKIVGIRFKLDRITVIQTDIKNQKTTRQYQWASERAPEALQKPGSFTKEDFLTLFNSYDEHGTTVLHYDNMSAYSPGATDLLIQGDAKTVLYAAMYCEGHYTGAVSYVTCVAKRYWSRQDRATLGELTKIISAHLAKNQALNASNQGVGALPEYDSLTGLLSFHRFREEVERLIVGGFATSHALIYTDFEEFSRVNREYGFSTGDMLLKEFSSSVIDSIENGEDTFFSRIVADHFVLFTHHEGIEDLLEKAQLFNVEFSREWGSRYPKAEIRLYSGVYAIDPNCSGVSAAVDAANFARLQLTGDKDLVVKLYDEETATKQQLESGLNDQVDDALKNGQIQVYLQPRISLRDHSVTGAEALVRWEQEDGTLLLPHDFIPLCERNGKVIDLDLYVFDQVAAFLARSDARHERPISISVNASILHTSEGSPTDRYKKLLEKHGVAPSRVQIEFAETDVVASHDDARQLLGKLQDIGIETALDNFGANRSMLIELVDAPINVVKLGRTFISTCEESDNGAFLLKQVVNLIKGLGYRVVCEGVETELQAKTLYEAGCDEGQGYLFSRPLPIEEFERFVYNGSKTLFEDES